MPGAKNPQMVDVKSVTVSPSCAAPADRPDRSDEVTLVEPKSSWRSMPRASRTGSSAPVAGQPGARARRARPALSLGRLRSRTARSLQRPQGRPSLAAEKIDFVPRWARSTAPSRSPARRPERRAAQDSTCRWGRGRAAGHDADITLEAGGGKLVFDGTLERAWSERAAARHVSSSADSDRLSRRPARTAGQGAPAAAAARRQILLRGQHRGLGPL